jgi:hypothetical protein
MIRHSFPSHTFHLEDADLAGAAQEVFEKVFRTDFSQPGFMILTLNSSVNSHELRQTMVELKQCLSALHQSRWGESLEYLSLGRFDQQTSTKLHLDGAPERSFLMLGYEATQVCSELQIADYTRCAHGLGMSPMEYLQQHNPMFSSGLESLQDYITTVTDWQETQPRIVIINNSNTALDTHGATAGVLHGAIIPMPDKQRHRIINSTMIAPSCFVSHDPAMQVQEFVSTEAVAGQILA